MPPASGSAAPPLPEGEPKASRDSTREDRPRHESKRESRRGKDTEERSRMEQAARDQEARREEDRRQAEAERQAARDKEERRKAKLGSAFLVDDEDEEDDGPQLDMAMAQKKDQKRFEERSGALQMDYTGGGQAAGLDGPEATRFVESMGGGSILQQAHKMLLQKAGGEMRSPSVVRRDRDKDRNRSRSRRRRRPSRSRERSPKQIVARPSGTGVRSSGSYRSPTPDGRARGQARAARKAKMIASMLGVQIPRR